MGHKRRSLVQLTAGLLAAWSCASPDDAGSGDRLSSTGDARVGDAAPISDAAGTTVDHDGPPPIEASVDRSVPSEPEASVPPVDATPDGRAAPVDGPSKTDASPRCSVDADCPQDPPSGCVLPRCAPDGTCTAETAPDGTICIVWTPLRPYSGTCTNGGCAYEGCVSSTCPDTDDNPCNGKFACAPVSVGRGACVGWAVPEPGSVCGDSPRSVCDPSGDCVASVCGDGVVDSEIGEQCEPPGTPGCDGACRFVGDAEAPRGDAG